MRHSNQNWIYTGVAGKGYVYTKEHGLAFENDEVAVKGSAISELARYLATTSNHLLCIETE